MSEFVDHYAVLGVKRFSTPGEIRRFYLKIAFTTHPNKGGDPEEFKKANEANEVLSDPKKRAAYNEEYDRHHPPPRSHRSREAAEAAGGGGGGGGGASPPAEEYFHPSAGSPSNPKHKSKKSKEGKKSKEEKNKVEPEESFLNHKGIPTNRSGGGPRRTKKGRKGHKGRKSRRTTRR